MSARYGKFPINIDVLPFISAVAGNGRQIHLTYVSYKKKTTSKQNEWSVFTLDFT